MAERKFIPIPPLPPDFWRRFDAKTERRGACLEWTGRPRNGQPDGQYGAMHLPMPDHRTVGAHRLAWVRHNGQIPEGMLVLHRCDNPRCVDTDHLFLGTDADNVADREAKGRNRPPIGEKSGNARLSNADVCRIRARLAIGETHRAISLDYGVCEATISHIASGRNWRKVV